MRRFVEGTDRGQSTLFPECLEDWIERGQSRSGDRRLCRRTRSCRAWVQRARRVQRNSVPSTHIRCMITANRRAKRPIREADIGSHLSFDAIKLAPLAVNASSRGDSNYAPRR